MKRREALKTGVLGLVAGLLGRRANTMETTEAERPDPTGSTIPHPDTFAEVNVHEYTGWRVTETIREDGTRSLHYDQASEVQPSFDEVNGSKAAILRKQRTGR